MSGTRTVYSSNLRTRRVHSLNNNNNERMPLVPAPINNQVARIPRAPSAYQSPNSRIHPATNELREARLNKFQATYNHDKDVFIAKEKAREIKKREEKLKRYKGVGELGNKLTDESQTDQEKEENYWKSRDDFQDLHDVSSRQALEDRTRREMEEVRLQSERLSLNSEANENGHRLGGNNRVNRARGEHPLLAKLNNTIH